MEFLREQQQITKGITGIIFCISAWACSAPEPEPPGPEVPCETAADSLLGFEALRSLYRGELVELREDRMLEGVVISSDREGNIFGSMYLQEGSQGNGAGIELRTDLLDGHTRFPPGSRVRISLKGLYLGMSGDGMALGAMREVFGNQVLDRLPAMETLERLIPCGTGEAPLVPRTVEPADLKAHMIHTLVRIPGVEVQEAYQGQAFAAPETETLIPLSDCSGGTVTLENSGFSDFASRPLPAGRGTATGILSGKEGAYRLVLRSASDLEMQGPTCGELYPPERSGQVLISEIADPDNEPGARFLELYNSGNAALDLKGWRLVRYTNDNESPGGTAALDGLRIPAGGTLVFSADPEVFESTYGMPPDATLRRNGPADSNGDDNILLINPFDEVTDAFGVPGEDGSGTYHEFEDGRALRRPEVEEASPVFRPGEWIMTNDSGGEGSLRNPLNAPEGYTPGTHPDREAPSKGF